MGRGGTGTAALISIRLSDGSVKAVDTGATGSNGMTAVLARDTNGDYFADTVYAGDLKGTHHGLAGTGASLLFAARDKINNPQPITAAPLARARTRQRALSGCFSARASTSSTAIWSIDKCRRGTASETTAPPSPAGRPLKRNILAEGHHRRFRCARHRQRHYSRNAGARGRYIDLESPVHGAEGERMVVPNRFQGAALIGTTRIPDASDICRPTGRGFIMAINPFTAHAWT